MILILQIQDSFSAADGKVYKLKYPAGTVPAERIVQNVF